jgi:hypothetical protein
MNAAAILSGKRGIDCTRIGMFTTAMSRGRHFVRTSYEGRTFSTVGSHEKANALQQAIIGD